MDSRWVWVLALAFVVMPQWGCSTSTRPIDGDGDVDADGDTDGDGDSDGDVDADGDSDGDSDGDVDADGDSDGDVDADGDSDGDADADGDTDADGDSDGDADADGDTDADGDGDCIPEGEWGSPWDTLSCCEGLAPIECAEEIGGGCGVVSECFICARCDDGTCGPGENRCNCPADCDVGPECVEEGGRAELRSGEFCCEGLTAIDCSEETSDGCIREMECVMCTRCGDGACGPGENICNCPEDCTVLPGCVREGEEGGPLEECCDGLTAVDCAEPDGDLCRVRTDCIVCTRCGDGTCGPGENICDCPEDCDGLPTCVPEGGTVVPGDGRECCDGLRTVGCEEVGAGGECIPCLGASYCTRCGDGLCGLEENFCRCPEDCEPEPGCLGLGERGDPTAGDRCCSGLDEMACAEPMGDACAGVGNCFICGVCGDGVCGEGENICNCPVDCESGEDCAGEGEFVPMVPGAPECCPGLTAVGCSEVGEDGRCTPCFGGSYCTRCGDGVCGIEENECRCPEDCGPEPACIEEGMAGSPFVGDRCCPGLRSISCAEVMGDACAIMTDCFICAHCGDGTCGPGENVCNCGDCIDG